jgi:2-phospho-L-lactate guanylyltransferase (CobY/MobA/RfbA family)
MNQIKQKTKQNKKSDVIAAIANTATAAMIFTTGTSHMISYHQNAQQADICNARKKNAAANVTKFDT